MVNSCGLLFWYVCYCTWKETTNIALGWVAYAVTAVVSAVGENRLMPLPDCACKVINGESGYVRDNTSWIIGRIVRDFDEWKDKGKPDGPISQKLKRMLDDKDKFDRAAADNEAPGSGAKLEYPKKAGLCVSVYKAEGANQGCPGYDFIYFTGFATIVLQLGIAAIPCGIFGDWGIFLITISGIILSFATGALDQWKEEKWACRDKSPKNVVLTRGNGSQHAIVILGDRKGFDLEDLAAGQTNVEVSAPGKTRFLVIILAALWILLLITASGLKENTWFLLAVGSVGILQNILVAGRMRFPKSYGIPLTFVEVIGSPKVMNTLYEVEEKYPHIGRSMVDTFFPGKLHTHEVTKWENLGATAKERAKALKESQINTQGNGRIQPAPTVNGAT